MNELHCRHCGLSAVHDAARLDADGTCALCQRAPSAAQRDRQRERARSKLLRAIETARRGPGPHATVAASGGKDSSYTLLRLKRDLKLDVNAVAVDNGYLSARAEENLRAVTDTLDIPLTIARPPHDELRALFAVAAREEPFPRSALQRASGVCNACIALVKSICLRAAVEQSTPLLAWGWSPGQAPLASATHRPTADLLESFEALRTGSLGSALGPSTRSMLVTHENLEGVEIPTFINPLAVEPYDEERIRAELAAIGWQAPADTDANSTNCRLNALGNHLHGKRHGLNPYSLELASLVREGWMDYEAAMQRLAADEDWESVESTARELGVEDLLTEKD